MIYLELSKKYIEKHYNNDKKKAIQAKDGIIFNDEKINKSFGDGWTGFYRYMKDNRQYCYFIKLSN